MIAALYANGNIGKDDLTNAIGDLEMNYQEAIDRILDRDWERKNEQAERDFANNPFFAKARAGVERIERVSAGKDERVADVVELRRGEIDQ